MMIGRNDRVSVRKMFPDWPWKQWDQERIEADSRLHERLSYTSPDWYDTPGGIALGWSLIGAVAAGVGVGLFVAPITTLLIVIVVVAVAG